MQAKTVIPFVNLSDQHQAIKEEVLTSFSDIVGRSAFILGREVEEFEHKFAQFCEARYAVGVGSGTDALILALKALGIGPGDEVMTVANTFVATAEAIVHVGARPVLLDVDPLSHNLDVSRIEPNITPRTRAIIPVHLFGQPADMAPIMAVARRYNLYVIEDAAQAHGAIYRGQRVGAIGDVGCFSFYPAKNLGAWGDGGAVVTNDEAIALGVQELRDHGAIRKYEHRRVGFTSRLDSLQAAVLTVKLRYLDGWNEQRQRIADRYSELLSEVPGVVCPTITEGNNHVFHLYVVRIESARREGLQQYLQDQGIATQIHYPHPIHLAEAFTYLGYPLGRFPVSERYSSQILSLPMYPGLELEKVEYVVEAMSAFLPDKIDAAVKGGS